jgi:hypothetical protein
MTNLADYDASETAVCSPFEFGDAVFFIGANCTP